VGVHVPWFVCNSCVSQVFNSCEVCSGWVTCCHRCLTCFKGLCVYTPGWVALWLVIDPGVNFVDVCIVIFGKYF
jgi:hypothetical protein